MPLPDRTIRANLRPLERQCGKSSMTEGPETQAQNSGSTQVEGVGLWGRLRRNLLTGIVVTAPIAITFYLAWQFISLLDEQANRLIPAAYNPENYLPFSVPGIGLLLIIAALTLIGALAKNYLGRYLLGTCRPGQEHKGEPHLEEPIPPTGGAGRSLGFQKQVCRGHSISGFRSKLFIPEPNDDLGDLGYLGG